MKNVDLCYTVVFFLCLFIALFLQGGQRVEHCQAPGREEDQHAAQCHVPAQEGLAHAHSVMLND